MPESIRMGVFVMKRRPYWWWSTAEKRINGEEMGRRWEQKQTKESSHTVDENAWVRARWTRRTMGNRLVVVQRRAA
ncbi:UNVERIFIED_CONTAM: hypothetical protein Slati_2706400 [Sesamum latifolium]|uniref:Uncharacterized protein n=1 Tax=Sesamum latifolium TaxID=2727402 RepID=A0AAW2W0L9_9LAMI